MTKAKMKRYTIPLLSREHCTKEYMDAIGLPHRNAGVSAYRWACHAMPLDVNIGGCHWTFFGKFCDMYPRAILFGWTASQFNAVAKALGAKPTGKPYPMPKKPGRKGKP